MSQASTDALDTDRDEFVPLSPIAGASSGPVMPGRPRRIVEATALYLICIAAAFGLSALLVAATGGDAGSVVDAILDGAFRAPGRWGETLKRAAPLLLVAIGSIVANRAGLANIGQEGQVLVGAATTAYVIVRFPGPGPLALAVALAVAFIVAGLWAGIAGVLKYWRSVPEVITTLLLIFVATNLVTFGLTKNWLFLDRVERQNRLDIGEEVPKSHRLPNWDWFGNNLELGVVIALVIALVAAYVLGRTTWGFGLRLLGASPRTAQRSGVWAAGVGTLALGVSGGLAGLAGGVMLTGGSASNRLTLGYSSNVGWDGLLVALLARNRPVVAILMALVFSGLRTGSGFLAATGINRQIVDVVQAMLVLALLIPPAIEFVRDRRRQLAGSAA